MALFRRALRFLFLIFGVVAGLVTAVAALFARRLISPPRQRIWATPADLGLNYEDVQFPAHDGVRLAGWFVPAPDNAARNGATLILVHGWPWNRLGEAAEEPLATLTGATPVDLLRLMFSLHEDGFHIFMFDLRNHGESAARPPVTFGQLEANDLLGALSYLEGRADVAASRIGAVGFSLGANAILYTLPQTDLIQAAIAVQPTTVSVFAGRFARYLAGPLGVLALPLVEAAYRRAGGMGFGAFQPAFAVAGAGGTPVLYVQGKGDPWGSAEDVARMAAATPRVQGPLFVEAMDRYGGYQYVIDNPGIVTAFFTQHLPE